MNKSIRFHRCSPLLVASLGLALGLSGHAQTAPATGGMRHPMSHDSADLSKQGGNDVNFVKAASAAGLAEVALGQLGATQGQSPQVKGFGRQMVKDHGDANQQLKAIATSKQLPVAQVPPPLDAQAAAAIGKRHGASFDAAFKHRMVEDHKKAVALFEQEAEQGQDPDLKAFAQKTLPTLRHHLELAQKLPEDGSSTD